MANIKSAKKRITVIEAKTAKNKRVNARISEAEKDFDKALAEKDFAKAEEKRALSEKKLMQAVAKGVVTKNAASRKVSRMQIALNKAQAK